MEKLTAQLARIIGGAVERGELEWADPGLDGEFEEVLALLERGLGLKGGAAPERKRATRRR